MTEQFKKSDIEILVSTMNRDSLNFIIPMFPFAKFTDFNILIVNQTTEKKLLVADAPNLKVINSFEKGLSKSRNLALKNATKKILLIADDDVVFLPGFDQKIASSFNENVQASAICFQTRTFEDKPFRNYKKEKFWMNSKQVLWVLSIEIAIKKEAVSSRGIVFNEHFGLGAQFQDSESLFFLRRMLHSKLKILYSPKDIVVHEKYSSSDEVTADRWMYAKAASFYKRFQFFSYLFLFKLLFFLVRKKLIAFNEIPQKMKLGFNGIRDYKTLLKSNSEHFYD